MRSIKRLVSQLEQNFAHWDDESQEHPPKIVLPDTVYQQLQSKVTAHFSTTFSMLTDVSALLDLAQRLKRFLLEKHDRYSAETVLTKIIPGDILAVERAHYIHYGIYAGASRVIHYTSEKTDLSPENVLMETTFTHFLRGETSCFRINLDKTFVGTNPLENTWMNMFYQILPERIKTHFPALGTLNAYHYYSHEEALTRARACLRAPQEEQYSLIRNNCEHFVYWCRTGVCHSEQVKTAIGSVLLGTCLGVLAHCSLQRKITSSLNRSKRFDDDQNHSTN